MEGSQAEQIFVGCLSNIFSTFCVQVAVIRAFISSTLRGNDKSAATLRLF